MKPDRSAPRAVVVMGVSGSGKSTIGEMLAERLNWTYRDGDAFHSAENIAKMSAGAPLSDADRWPWLRAIAAWIDELRQNDTRGIVACSALRRAYRDVLTSGQSDVFFAHLAGSFELIAERLAQRSHHFMPPELLKSQFDDLELPMRDERAASFAINRSKDDIVAAILHSMECG